MLYYTYRDNGTVKATYSGRFSFIALADYDEFSVFKSLQNGDDLRALWANPLSDEHRKAASILAHEYTHKHIFSLSDTGHILNGWRMWARIRFLIGHSTEELEAYYTARTIYLKETYAYHETIADRVDQALSSNPESAEAELRRMAHEEFKGTIQLAEHTIRQKWEQLHIAPDEVSECIFHPLGKWLQANFALMLSYTNDDKETVDSGFADQGVTNDVGTIRKHERRTSIALKKLLNQCITLPIRRHESFEKYFEWFWIGQRTQVKTLKQIYGISFEEFLTQNLMPTTPYIINWAGVPHKIGRHLITLTEDALQLDRPEFDQKWASFIEEHKGNRRFERFFTFFHLHGN